MTITTTGASSPFRGKWTLEGSPDGAALPRRFPLEVSPTRIGRSPDSEIVLPVGQVSGLHAEIFEREGEPWLRDLGSSNGTRLNRQRLESEARLSDGDVVRFADLEFVVERSNAAIGEAEVAATCMLSAGRVAQAAGARIEERDLRLMLQEDRVAAVFQPIVNFADHEDLGFEVLGRGDCVDLPESPGPLFQIAERIGVAATLSGLFRCTGLAAAADLPGKPRLFINAHPQELVEPGLMEALSTARHQFPDTPITLEVHESTVTDPKAMKQLRAALSDLDIGLAYDDFGAGQARLLELSDAPPDCLKFDMGLIRDIDRAPASRQDMVSHLLSMVRDLGVTCLAEGIERRGELDACRQLGFDLAQGFYLGRPQPAKHWFENRQWLAILDSDVHTTSWTQHPRQPAPDTMAHRARETASS